MKQKSLHIIFLYSMLFAACSDNIEIGRNTYETGEVPMSFTVKSTDLPDESSTRFNDSYYIDSTIIPQGQQIGVFAFDQGTTLWDDLATKTANFMYNQPMTSAKTSADEDTLTYSPVRYWTPDHMYAFYAYYPFSATVNSVENGIYGYGVTITPSNIGVGDGAGSIHFKMQPEAKNQTDFLVSDLTVNHIMPGMAGNLDKRVSFSMHHALSSLSFTINLTHLYPDITLDDPTPQYHLYTGLYGIYTEGNLSTTNSYEISNSSWQLTNTGNVHMTNFDAEKEGSSDNYDTQEAATFLVLPQSPQNIANDDDTYLIMEFHARNYESNGKHNHGIYINKISNIMQDAGWREGVKYNYTIYPRKSEDCYKFQNFYYPLILNGKDMRASSSFSIPGQINNAEQEWKYNKYLIYLKDYKVSTSTKLVIDYTCENSSESALTIQQGGNTLTFSRTSPESNHYILTHNMTTDDISYIQNNGIGYTITSSVNDMHINSVTILSDPSE
jgi:hypothetical protein